MVHKLSKIAKHMFSHLTIRIAKLVFVIVPMLILL